MGYKEDLKTKLEFLMKQANVSNETLAEHTGISRSSINRIRMNKGNPTLETLRALSDFFKISIQELTDNSATKSKQDRTFGTMITQPPSVPLLSWDSLAAQLDYDNSNVHIKDLYAVVSPQEYKHIPKSSLIYFDKNRVPAHGDYVLVIDKENGEPHVAEYMKDIHAEYVRSCLVQVLDPQPLIPLKKFHILGVLMEARKIFIPN